MRSLPLLIPLIALVVGCQPYQRSPLKVGRYHTEVESRDPSSQAVMEYAKQIRLTATERTPYNPADGLSMHEAEVVALFFNPQLRLSRLKANVARVGAAEAGRWHDPELAVDAERIIQAVPEPWVLAGTLSFTLPLSGRLGVEKKQARAEATVAQLRVLVEEQNLLTDLRIAWVEWSVAQERTALTRQVIQEFSQIAERAERLQKAGEVDPIDAALLRLEMVKRSGDLHKSQADVESGEIQLKSRLGLLPTAEFKLVPSVSASTTIPAFTPARLNDHPRARVARGEYEVAERTLELEVRRQYPDLKVGAGFGTDEGDERLLGGASVPLPLLNANRRAIAEARANREVARAAYEAVYEQLLADASAAQLRVAAADARVRYVEQEVGPLADRQVQNAQRLAKVGELNALMLVEALRTAHEAKLEVLNARLDLALARLRLASLLEVAPAASTTQPTTAPTTAATSAITTTREVKP